MPRTPWAVLCDVLDSTTERGFVIQNSSSWSEYDIRDSVSGVKFRVYVLWLCHTVCSEGADGFKLSFLRSPSDSTPWCDTSISRVVKHSMNAQKSQCVFITLFESPSLCFAGTKQSCLNFHFYNSFSSGISFGRTRFNNFSLTFVIICMTDVMWDD